MPARSIRLPYAKPLFKGYVNNSGEMEGGFQTGRYLLLIMMTMLMRDGMNMSMTSLVDR